MPTVPFIIGDPYLDANFAALAADTGATASTGVLILESALGSAQASVTFSAIPATYRDLRVVIRGRCSADATAVAVGMQFNGDTGNNYDSMYYAAQSSSSVSNSNTSQVANSFANLGPIAAGQATADLPALSEIFLGDYRGVTFQKVLQVRTTNVVANNDGGLRVYYGGALWRSKSAINQVKVFPTTGNFVTGSVVSLYGVY